jgi:hypothetical protein
MAKKVPTIDWPKAQVNSDSQLTVPIKGTGGLGPSWAEALEFVTSVRNNETRTAGHAGGQWESIEVDAEGGLITVAEVGEGSETALAKTLDGLVSSAVTAAIRAEEAAEEAGEGEAASKAKEMQKRFRSFRPDED